MNVDGGNGWLRRQAAMVRQWRRILRWRRLRRRRYGGYGGWGGGYGGWGGGYYGPPAYGGGYYGDWYNGCWNHAGWGGFWAGMGVGALTSWGLNALYNPLYAYSYGMSSYFPTWGAYGYSTWGLESVASPWLYERLRQPLYHARPQTTIVQQPVPVPADTGAAAAPRDSRGI